MRKCGFILLLHALLLLMCVPSWGEGFNISSMTTAYKTVYSVDVKANYRANIIIRTNVQYYGNDVTADYYATNVGSIKWTVMNSDGALTDCKLVQSDDETTEVDNDDIADLKEDKTYRFRLTGNIAKAGKVTVIATLKAGKDSPLVYGQYGIHEQSIDITFSATSKDASGNVITSDETGDNAPTEDIDASSIAPDTDTLDPRDPDSRKWNGLLPPFTFTPGTVAAGVKPKVTWTKPEDFEAGTSTDTVVATITGPVTGVNVYIADKDATKLFGVNLAKGETIGDIPLTKANIKAYNIPFRVTSVDASKNTASNDKKKDKEAVTTVTVAFNGGNFEYKGFPITVSAWNSNNSDKPAAKTVKLTVTPNESTPEWGSGYIGTRTTRVGGTLVTTTTTGKVSTPYSTSSYSTWINWQTQGNSAYKGGTGITLTPSVGYTYNYNNTLKNSGGNPLEVKYHFEDGKRVRYEYNSTNINAGIYPAYNIYNNTSFGTENYNAWAYNSSYSVEQRGKYWNAVIPTTFILTVSQQGPQTSSEYVGATYKTVPYVSFTSVDLKEKHEIVVGIYPDKEAGEQGGSVPTTTYNVLAPAPYIITAKAPKEDTGIYVSITQPVF
ncbi:MAG: hypothetical protein IJP54_05705, partial [Synergistaceae bacterium]|nr:hypothetical protein [Synergistaceae bacterium]